MNKKPAQFTAKLWKMTAFSIFSEPGKKQSQLIQQSFQSIFRAFNSFQKSISLTFNELRNHKLNIPALIKVRQDVIKENPKILKFIELERSSMESILSHLSSFRFVVQKTQKNVLLGQQQSIREYEEKIRSFLSGREENSVSMRKMERIHEEFMNLKYDYKMKIRNHESSSSFQKWLADFHIRAEEFFMKSYSYDWQNEMREIAVPFAAVGKQSKFGQKVCSAVGQRDKKQNEIEMENKYEQQFEVLFDKQSEFGYEKLGQSLEMQDQNDIVGQIYKQYQSHIVQHML